jgi:ribosomal protein L37AE/L43A
MDPILMNCFKCKGRGWLWNGGAWTAQYAEEKLGKRVIRVAV